MQRGGAFDGKTWLSFKLANYYVRTHGRDLSHATVFWEYDMMDLRN